MSENNVVPSAPAEYSGQPPSYDDVMKLSGDQPHNNIAPYNAAPYPPPGSASGHPPYPIAGQENSYHPPQTSYPHAGTGPVHAPYPPSGPYPPQNYQSYGQPPGLGGYAPVVYNATPGQYNHNMVTVSGVQMNQTTVALQQRRKRIFIFTFIGFMIVIIVIISVTRSIF